jgi:hypothetical protein
LGTVEGSNKIQLTYDKVFFKRKKPSICINLSIKVKEPGEIYNTLKLLNKIQDSPVHPDEGFESMSLSFYNSNKFIVLIFIACSSPL